MANGKVLMVYTGGTIGMLPKDPENNLSPLRAADWDDLKKFVPILGKMGVDVTTKQMTPIDSSDMNPTYWINIAKAIYDSYKKYDGFVILHGTDTMTYTATALSFLLENLGKPVIVTGSQLPIGRARNDGLQNLVTSIMLAAPRTFDFPIVPEVCIFFDDVLLRGNRARKMSSTGYHGFESPNFVPLAHAGEHISFDTKVIRRVPEEDFFINEKLEEDVMVFDIFPGMKPEILKQLFSIPKLQGVVLRTFGAGNAMTKKDFLDEVQAGIDKGLAIVNLSQCPQGMVEMGLYDASAELQRIGMISGVDMTPEAALIKMQFLLGLGYDKETMKEQMQKDLRGEQSVNVFNFFYGEGTAPGFKSQAQQLPSGFDPKRAIKASIRVDTALPETDNKRGAVELAFFANYPSAEETARMDRGKCLEIPQCVGIIGGSVEDDRPLNMVLDCRERLGRLLSAGRPLQLSVVARTAHPVSWRAIAISVYTSVD